MFIKWVDLLFGLYTQLLVKKQFFENKMRSRNRAALNIGRHKFLGPQQQGCIRGAL